MANKEYRNRIISSIENAINEYHDCKDIGHSFLIGRIREIAIKRLIEPILPFGYAIGTGKIVDSEGNKSNEVDIIIYSKYLLPPLLYENNLGLFPVESCLVAIEIKSKLTASTLKSALKNGRSIHKNLTPKSGYHNLETGQAIKHNFLPIYRILFAFESDLKDLESEFNRYEKYDLERNAERSLDCICVLGNGFISYSGIASEKWGKNGPTKEYDEVITMLYGLTNSLHFIAQTRGIPMLGYYLNQE